MNSQISQIIQRQSKDHQYPISHLLTFTTSVQNFSQNH